MSPNWARARILSVLERCTAHLSLPPSPETDEAWQRLADHLEHERIDKDTPLDQLPSKLLFIASGQARVEGSHQGRHRSLGTGGLLRLELLVTWARGAGKARPPRGVALKGLEVLSLPPSRFLEVLGGKRGQPLREALLAVHDARERADSIVSALAEEPRLANAQREHLYILAESTVWVRPFLDGSLPEREGTPRDFDLLLEGTCHVSRGPGKPVHFSAPACIGLRDTLGTKEGLEKIRVGPRAAFARISGQCFQRLREFEPDFDWAVRRGSPEVALLPPRDPVPHQFIVFDGMREPVGRSPDASSLAWFLAEALAKHLHEHVLLVRVVSAPGPSVLPPSPEIHVPNPDGNGWWMEVRVKMDATGLAASVAQLSPDPWQLLPAKRPDKSRAGSASPPASGSPQQVTEPKRKSVGEVNVTLLDVSRLSPEERDSVLAQLVKPDAEWRQGPIKFTYLTDNPETRSPWHVRKGLEVVPVGVIWYSDVSKSLGDLLRGPRRGASQRLEVLAELARTALNTLHSLATPPDERPAWPVGTVRVSLPMRWYGAAIPLVPSPEVEGFGEAMGRWARALTGRRIGLALGGGGALAFSHVGLIQKLHTSGEPIPIDLISGSSFGAVVGAFYSAEGMKGLDRLLKSRHRMQASVWLGLLLSATLEWWTDLDLHGEILEWWTNLELKMRTLQQLEVPFFPVVTNLSSGTEWDVRQGRIGLGLRASGSLPPIFNPASVKGQRLIDGGVVANVPINILRLEGADIVIASNPLPRAASSRRSSLGADKLVLSLPLLRRLRDGMRAQSLMARTAGESQEFGPYTVLFKPEYSSAQLISFSRGLSTAEKAREGDDAARTLREVRRMWRSRLNNPVSAIRKEDNTLELLFQPISERETRAPPLGAPGVDELVEHLIHEAEWEMACLKIAAFTRANAERWERKLKPFLALNVPQTLTAEWEEDRQIEYASVRVRVTLSHAKDAQSENIHSQAHSFVRAIESHRRLKAQARLAEFDARARHLLDVAESQSEGDAELTRLLALEASKWTNETGPARFSPNEARLAQVLRTVLRSDYLLVGELEHRDTQGRRAPVRSLAWNPEGTHLVIGGQWSNLQIHAVPPGKAEPRQLPVGGDESHAVLWGQRQLIGCGTDSIHVFPYNPSQTNPLELDKVIKGSAGTWDQWGLSLSPDGKWLVATAGCNPYHKRPEKYVNVGLYCLDGAESSLKSQPLGFHVYAEYSWDAVIAWSKAPPYQVRWRPAAWAPDGQRFAVAGVAPESEALRDCVRIWRVEGKAPCVERTLPLTQARSVAWHPAEQRLAAGGADGAFLWMLGPQQEVRELRLDTGGSPVDFLDWSPGGERLATAGARSSIVHLWNSDGALEDTVRIENGHIEGLVWSPNGEGARGLLAIWTGNATMVWDAIARRRIALLGSRYDRVRQAAWSLEGKLAVGTTEGLVRIWQFARTERPGKPTLQQYVDQMIPGWAELVRQAGDEAERALTESLRQGDLQLPGEAALLTEQSELSSDRGIELPMGEHGWAAFSPNRRAAVIALEDQRMVLVSPALSACVPLGFPPAPRYSRRTRAVWSPDGSFVALWGVQGVAVWDASGNERLNYMEGASKRILVAVAWEPSGKRLALTWWGEGYSIWHAESRSLTSYQPQGVLEVWWMDWSQRGNRLAMASNAREAVIHTDDRPSHLLRITHPIQPLRVAWNPRGTLLAIGDRSGAVRILNEQQEDLVQSPQERLQEIQHLLWHPRGTHLLCVAKDGRALLWERDQTGWVIGSVLQEGGSPIRWAAFSTNGKWVGLMSDPPRCQLRLFPTDFETLVRCVEKLPWRNAFTDRERHEHLGGVEPRWKPPPV